METSDIFNTQSFQKTITISPEYINKNLNTSIEKVLNKSLGNRCNREGFIKKDSIQIIKKSLGIISTDDNTGNIKYNITVSADVCNPIRDNIYRCAIENMNKMGIIAYALESDKTPEYKPMYILVPHDYIGENISLDQISNDSVLYIQVVGKKFKYNDTVIQVIGKVLEIE